MDQPLGFFGPVISGEQTNLLLVLLKGAVLLSECRDVGLVGDFEHGDSLDGHFGGSGVDCSTTGCFEMIADVYRTCERKCAPWKEHGMEMPASPTSEAGDQSHPPDKWFGHDPSGTRISSSEFRTRPTAARVA